MPRQTVAIALSESERRELERWRRAGKTERRMLSRIQIIELAAAGLVFCKKGSFTSARSSRGLINCLRSMAWIRSCHINNLDNRAYPWHELFALLRGINFDRYTFAEIGQPSCEPLRLMNYYRALWDYHTGLGRP